jgi:quercetin dioxygenase-like cupin family protein
MRPFCLAPDEGERIPWIGVVKISLGDVDGSLEVFEYTGPAAPPPHVHRGREEIFYILEGSFVFQLEDEEIRAGAGSLLFVPRGTRHSFTMEDGSRALLIIAPAGLGPYFAELGAALESGRPSTEVRHELGQAHDSIPA